MYVIPKSAQKYFAYPRSVIVLQTLCRYCTVVCYLPLYKRLYVLQVDDVCKFNYILYSYFRFELSKRAVLIIGGLLIKNYFAAFFYADNIGMAARYSYEGAIAAATCSYCNVKNAAVVGLLNRNCASFKIICNSYTVSVVNI